MQYGISVYPGLDNSFEENRALIEEAARFGVTRLFTSLHIPEADPARFAGECRALLKAAKAVGMEVIADTTPESLALLGVAAPDAKELDAAGIQTLRLDEGFPPEEIARLSRSGLRVQLNASTVGAATLRILERERADFRQIDALHNFYPRSGTGLSEAYFLRQNERFAEYGIPTAAFVASRHKKRGPLFEGLPTMEDQREWDVDFAARYLAALGLASIFIGDARPSTDELAALARTRDGVTLKIQLSTRNEGVRRLLAESFTARPEEARDAIRARESRALVKRWNLSIPPEDTHLRHFGAVTVDNDDYPRYTGELEIILRPQPADLRVNIVGKLPEKEFFLLPYLKPGRPFSFVPDHMAAFQRYQL